MLWKKGCIVDVVLRGYKASARTGSKPNVQPRGNRNTASQAKCLRALTRKGTFLVLYLGLATNA
jgi:hypothetical protein